MTKFFGRSHIKIDPKGRFSLPTSLRQDFMKSKNLVLTNNLYQGYRFLDLYTLTEWQKFEKKVSSWPALKPEIQAFQRFYVSSAESGELDGQGRLLIPTHFREFAQLVDDIVLVGVGVKIEIWSAKDWLHLFGQIEKDYERISQIISEYDEQSVMSPKRGAKAKKGSKE